MAEEEFDVRLDQVQRAVAVINTIKDNPELQAAAFSHLFGTAPSLRGSSSVDVIPEPAASQAKEPEKSASEPRRVNSTRRAGKAPAVTQDKSVELAPADAPSWMDFAAEKAPGNANEKYTVATYWLTEVANVPPATIGKVVYLFIAAKWSIPADPRNKASVAGSSGYIDSGDTNNLKVTALGTALVLNDLPRKKSAK